MAILHSKNITGASAKSISNPGVQQALKLWEHRLENEKQKGHEEGVADSESQIAEANKILEEAKKIREETELRINEAKLEMANDLGNIIGVFNKTIQGVRVLEKQALLSSERHSVRLALAIASHILRYEVEERDDWINDSLVQALLQVPDKRNITVRLHQKDAAIVKENIAELTREGMLDRPFEVESDDTMSLGSCIIESGGTVIDTGTDISLRRIGERLLSTAPDPNWSEIIVANDEEKMSVVPDVSSNSEENSLEKTDVLEEIEEKLDDTSLEEAADA